MSLGKPGKERDNGMRVITGEARGRRLTAPAGLDTRPTTDLVKEAVFSIIQFEVPGAHVLDLFAGSGQMGVEALSRGAASAVFVDSGRAAITAVRENLEVCGFTDRARVYAMDAKAYLASCAERFDIAFLDPPYGSGAPEALLAALARRMNENGVILCETQRGDTVPETAGPLRLTKQYRYGKTMVHLYRGAGE